MNQSQATPASHGCSTCSKPVCKLASAGRPVHVGWHLLPALAHQTCSAGVGVMRPECHSQSALRHICHRRTERRCCLHKLSQASQAGCLPIHLWNMLCWACGVQHVLRGCQHIMQGVTRTVVFPSKRLWSLVSCAVSAGLATVAATAPQEAALWQPQLPRILQPACCFMLC